MQAAPGHRVVLEFEDDFGMYCRQGKVCYHWLEVRYEGNLGITGPRLVEYVVAMDFSLNYTKLATLEIKAYVGKRKINLAIKCYLLWALNMGPLVSKFMYGGSSGVEPRQSTMEALTKCSHLWCMVHLH